MTINPHDFYYLICYALYENLSQYHDRSHFVYSVYLQLDFYSTLSPLFKGKSKAQQNQKHF